MKIKKITILTILSLLFFIGCGDKEKIDEIAEFVGLKDDLDMSIFEQELCSVVEAMLAENPEVGAIVLECTDLSHFAPVLQQKYGLPIFDLTSLTRMIAAGVTRTVA